MLAAPWSLTDIVAWLCEHAPAAQLSSDSRTLLSGEVFFACQGGAAARRQHIAQALEKGAQAIVFDDSEGLTGEAAWGKPYLAVPALKKYAGLIANAYYDRPDARMFVVAVTGTNGKTSCSHWLANAMARLGEASVAIGTLGVGLFAHGQVGSFSTTGYTTPDAVQLQRQLAKANRQGASTLAIEASSIGLQEGRLAGLHVDVALFTNLTRDHLDYHGDMAAYEAAKAMLFDWPGLRHAVLNLDDQAGQRLVRRIRQTNPSVAITGYTLGDQVPEGDMLLLRATEVRSNQAATVFRIDSPWGSAQVKAQVVGQFNVGNLLGVIGVLLAKGVAWRDALQVVEALPAVPGRMQQLGGHEAPLVVVDYAHTSDALEKTLAALRQVARERAGELWCVFGCGGDRDPGKRPQMGAASQAADHVVVTSDNPRSENPQQIMAQIALGMDASKPHLEIEDRAAAILWAVKHAARQDVVLLAGKGHEAYQEIKGRRSPFLDADHAALALAARVTMKGGV